MDQLHLKVTKIKRETAHASTILVERSDGQPLLYEAGQFLTLIFPSQTTELRRSYSLSSTPGIDDFVSITVKRVSNGEISRWLLDHLQVGYPLISLPAAGRFTVKSRIDLSRQFFFIAAGSGISPIFSLIKKILAEEPSSQVTLLYQNRDQDDIIFEIPLRKLQRDRGERFKWINLLSRPRIRPPYPERLNNFLLYELISEERNRERPALFYLCGPPSFMRMIQFTLRLMGFSDEQIKRENFTVEYVPPPPLISDRGLREIIIHRNNQVFQFYAAYPSNILQAALDNHIQLPYSCRGGRCSTCIARLLKGKVKMSINEVLTDQDLEEGWILTCVAYPDSDVEISFT